MKQGKIKKQKPLPEISEEEKPFELPEGWEWVRISEIGHDWGQKTPDKDFTYIDVGSINKEYGIIEEPSILSAKDAPSRARKIVQQGTIIYSTVRPYLLNIAIIENEILPEPIASTAFAIIHPYTAMDANFIYYYLRSPVFVCYVENCQTGVAYPAINDKQFFSGITPVPPSLEQVRIANKIKELMSLCDQLEQQSLTSLDAHQQLVETLLGTLTDSQNAEELAENWARISEHFDTLFTTEASVDALKQTILQLAVMGKLVPQDPNDEPASELLKRIAQEKAQLVKEGKIKKQKPLPPISDEEKPFELPEGWEWCRIGNIVNIKSELVSPKDYLNLYQVAPDIIEKGTGRVISKRTVKESGVKGPNSRFYKGQIVYSKIRPSLSKVFLAEYNGLCSADMYPLDCYINPHYLLKYILSIPFLMQVKKAENRIKMPKLNSDSFYNIIVAIPPCNEQQAIFDKINSIEAVCNGLISYIGIYHKTQLHLADALTDAAIN